MQGTMEVRLLTAAEIECRIAAISEKGLSLLLYKDARVDQKILDETYTPLGWRRTHQSINGSLYCTVEVWDDKKGQWIEKQDVGTESYSEKEKGQASDSFKRACFNWGIGRELYTAPFIWVPAEKVYIEKKDGKGGREERYTCRERFTVKSISYNGEREITSLEIADSKGRTVYSMCRGAHGQEGQTKVQQKKLQQAEAQTWGTGTRQTPGVQKGIDRAAEVILMAELNRTGVSLEEVLERYGIDCLGRMTQEIYSKALSALKQTRPKAGKTGSAA